MEPLGYAVIGLGAISQQARPASFQCHSTNARLAASVSGDKEKAGRLARDFGEGSHYAYEELAACLSSSEVEAVYMPLRLTNIRNT
jgi:predicted dehydrogenase